MSHSQAIIIHNRDHLALDSSRVQRYVTPDCSCSRLRSLLSRQAFQNVPYMHSTLILTGSYSTLACCNNSTHTELYKYSIYNTIHGMAKSRRVGVTGRASIVQLSNSGLPTEPYLQFQRLKESASRAC